jgi:class 3 adenylate cyclase/WD40 repeat protein
MTARAPRGGRAAGIRTFLIADVRGYTRFTAELGDEAASRLATKFAQICAEGFEAWDGRLLELRGDEALGVFESARNAIRAAAELQSTFADETRTEPNLPLTVGIGVDAGEAVAVGDGYRGAALNLAARLCATAAAGEIRTTESLAHLVGQIDGITFTRLPSVQLKGIESGVVPVLVADESAAESAIVARVDREAPAQLPAELDSLVPFAGRTRELLRLRWHWRRARHGHGRTVLVIGPRGIGKTRLAAELATESWREGARVVYGAGESIGDGLLGSSADDERPRLVVLDDLDRASPTTLERIREMSRDAMSRPNLCLLASGTPMPQPVEEAISAGAIDRIPLGALETEAIRAIVEVYAEAEAAEAPIALIEAESDGVPAAVHRVASQWARNQATRRLGGSAARAAAGRRELRAAEGELVDDLGGLDRARELTRLFVADADEAEDSARPAICPYKGLATFERADAEYFFGRDRLVAEMVARLVGSPFVALVGASGSGKSSALRAGLLPALSAGVLPGSDRWTQILIRPGAHPLDELGSALDRVHPGMPEADDVETRMDRAASRLATDERMLIVVDQFEEAFAVTDEAERARFIDLLTATRPGVKVIVALRADHYGHGAAYPGLARLLSADQILVGPVAAADLATIVERPAQSVGLRVEPELTATLVDDAGEEPGALPLLSTALLELWELRSDNTLKLAAYHARGGLRGAVARLAEGAFTRLTASQRVASRGVFLRLAGAGEGETLVRRRVPLEEFDVADADVQGVLDVMTARRLLSTGDRYVEVAHEALLREWPRLQGWLADDAAGRSLRLHLIGAAREWDQGGREAGDLYRGARLAAVLDWAAEHALDLNPIERAFLDEGRRLAEAEADRQRRTNRRLRLLVAGAAVFGIAALVGGGFAFLQRQEAVAEATRADDEAARAERERETAERAESVARSRELAAAAVAYMEDDASLSKLLALSAASIADPPIETLSALHQAWASDRIVARYTWPEDEVGNGVAAVFSPDGSRLAASGDSSYLEVIDWRSGEVIWSYDPGVPDAWVSQPYFTRDGQSVVVSVLYAPAPEVDPDPAEGMVGLHVFDAGTGHLQRTLNLGHCGGFLLGMGDTHAIVTAEVDEGPCTEFEDPARDLVDLRTGERTRLTADGSFAAISADGRRVAYDDLSSGRTWTYVVDTSTVDRILTIDVQDLSRGQQDSYTRALNNDGSLLVYGDRPINVWDVDAGETIAAFGGHAGESNGIAFAGEGEEIYSTGRDATLRLWEARTGDQLERYGGIGSGTVSVVDSGYGVVGRSDATAVVVDLRTAAEVIAVPTCRGFVPGGQLGVAGGLAAMTVQRCDDPASGTSIVADLTSGEVVVSEGGAAAQDQALSPDGRRFVRQEGSYPTTGPLTVRDTTTGDVLVELRGTCTWDASITGEEAASQPGCDEPPYVFWAGELSWSPDGSKIVGIDGAGLGGLFVWDSTTGEVMFHHPLAASSAIFTPDGQEVLVATDDDLFAPEDDAVHVVRFDVDSGAQRANASIDVYFPDFIGFSADGSTVYIVDQPSSFDSGTLLALSASGFEVLRSRERVSDGSVKASGMNGDGSQIVTGSSDGFVRIWDAATFDLVHEIFIGETQVQGAAFVNDTQVAIAPEEGNIYVMTIDRDELLAVVRSSLTRGFSEAECERFNFGSDCPTLEELQSGS